MIRSGKLFPFLFFLTLTGLTTYTLGCKPDPTAQQPDSSIHDTIPADPPEEPKKKLTGTDIRLEKEIRYDTYLLDDEYPYKDTTRHFQWDKIKEQIAVVENAMAEGGNWGVLSNYKNKNKEAPTIANFVRDDYKLVSDQYGVERYQAAPLYSTDGDTTLLRYGRDGWIVKLPDTDTTAMIRVTGVSVEGEYLVPKRYVLAWGDSVRFDKVIAVDVTNQNIATLEKKGDTWHILSMTLATTGVHKPPHAHETPTGIFAVQEKKEKMYYLVDGTSEIAGFAPYATRFTNGAYVHGVPTQYPHQGIIENSPTLGTVPRSHMCVRNPSSHSKFVFEWASVRQTVVIVIE